MNDKGKDNSKAMLAIIIIGAVVFLTLFVLLCIYSRQQGVKFFATKPLCLIPFAELGLIGGLFIGCDKEMSASTKLLFNIFWKLVLVVIVFEVIRGIATDGVDGLLAVLAVVGDSDDSDINISLLGYYFVNILTAAPVTLAAMFIGRFIGRAVSGAGKSEG